MTPQQFEEYCFYRLYSIDLDTVRHSLRMLKRYRRQDVRHSILRDIVVGYARPFSGNKGKLFKKYHLSMKSVPSDLRSLHSEMPDVRMRTLAHTDYSFVTPGSQDGQRARGRFSHCRSACMTLENLDKRLTEIERLVKAVESSVNAKVRTIEREVFAYEPQGEYGKEPANGV